MKFQTKAIKYFQGIFNVHQSINIELKLSIYIAFRIDE